MKGDVARITSPPVAPGVKCLNFWYHMFGPHVDTLNVYAKTGLNLRNPVWTKTGTQGNFWLQANVTITTKVPFSVSIISWLTELN